MKPKDIINKAVNKLNQSLVKELATQGHRLTGALERSIIGGYSIVEQNNNVEGNGFALDYALDLENGGKINGSYKDHVGKMVTYFKLRGLSDEEALKAAILTSDRHKKEGIPTEASKRFSKTGERKHFISIAWKGNEKRIDAIVENGTDSFFKNEFQKQKNETI